MNEYHLEKDGNGTFALSNSKGLVGFVTAVTTQNSVYYLDDIIKDAPTPLRESQIYSGRNGLQAFGVSQMHGNKEIVTSRIQSLSIWSPTGSNFEVPARDVLTTTDLVLTTSNGQKVSVQGDYAAQIFGDQNAIDDEFKRQVRVAGATIDTVRASDLRMSNFPVLGQQ